MYLFFLEKKSFHDLKLSPDFKLKLVVHVVVDVLILTYDICELLMMY